MYGGSQKGFQMLLGAWRSEKKAEIDIRPPPGGTSVLEIGFAKGDQWVETNTPNGEITFNTQLQIMEMALYRQVQLPSKELRTLFSR
jgi:hypothetical protein